MEGNLEVSTNPTGGEKAWSSAATSGSDSAFESAACPSTSLCVATHIPPGYILTSTTPSTGPWTETTGSKFEGLNSVACPSTTLCIAVNQQGDAVTSTNPTGGEKAWTLTPADQGSGFPGPVMLSVACPSSKLCVAGDVDGNVVTSTNPTGGEGAWTTTHIDESTVELPNELTGASCTPSGLCVGIDQAGNVVSSTNPAGGAGTWSQPAIIAANGSLADVSCPSSSFCAATANGNILTTSEPAEPFSWVTTKFYNFVPSLRSIDCLSTTLCFAFDDEGNVLSSSNPTGGKAAWSTAAINPEASGGQAKISCGSPTLCVVISGTKVYVSTEPTGGASAWTLLALRRNSTRPCQRRALWKLEDALHNERLKVQGNARQRTVGHRGTDCPLFVAATTVMAPPPALHAPR
jgi:hypothetical protein